MGYRNIGTGSICAVSLLLAAAVFSLGGCTTGHASTVPEDPTTVWTHAYGEAHARRQNDPSEWDVEMLDRTVSALAQAYPDGRPNSPLPFPTTLFPSVDYNASVDWFIGIGLGEYGQSATARAAGAAGQSALFGIAPPPGWPPMPENPNLFADAPHRHVMTVVAQGPEPMESVDGLALSRGFPYLFWQGTLRSTLGEVRWVAVRLPDGRAIGVVNGRVFDLQHGDMIFVSQKEDGSIRALQTDSGLTDTTHVGVQRRLDQLIKSDTAAAHR